MKILNLIIKAVHFKEILDGSKTKELREIRPASFSKYYEYGPDKDPVGLIKYDALRLFNGYAADRPTVVVEVTGHQLVIIDDDKGNHLTYTEKGIEYVQTMAEYSLGKILQKQNC